MNYSRASQIIMAIIFFATFYIPSKMFALGDSPENLYGKSMLSSLPDCVRPDKWWHDRQARIARENATLYVGEKPNFMKLGYYERGRYVQCNLDMQGASTAMLAGGCFRFLYSVATCGTEYKKFKQAAFTPGVAKSFLFWVPAIVAYQFVVNAKDHEAFVQKMHDRNDRYNPHNQFGQEKVD